MGAQTLLALGALLVSMLLSLNTQRSVIRNNDRMFDNEGESLALAVGTELLDRAATLRFDVNANAGQTSQLTPAGSFGTQARTVAAATDLDDLHNATDAVQVTSAGQTVTIARAITVRYVTRSGSEFVASGTQTFVKQVTVVATGPNGTSVTLSRLYPHRPGVRTA